MLLNVIFCYYYLFGGLFWFIMESGSKVNLSGRYCCVNRCSSSDYNLNNWGNLQCLVHNCLNRSDERSCKPPYHLYTIPTKAKNPVMKKKWLHLINRAKKTLHQTSFGSQGRQPEFARNISLMVTWQGSTHIQQKTLGMIRRGR